MDVILKSANVHLYSLVPFKSSDKGDKQYVPFRQMMAFRKVKINAATHEKWCRLELRWIIQVWQVKWNIWYVLPEQYFSRSPYDFSICKVTIPMTIGDKKGKRQIMEKLTKTFRYRNKSKFYSKRLSLKLCKNNQYQVANKVIFAWVHSSIKELEYLTDTRVIFDRACPFLIGFILFAWIKRRIALLGTGLHGGDPWLIYRKNQSNHCIWSKYKTMTFFTQITLRCLKYFCIGCS